MSDCQDACSKPPKFMFYVQYDASGLPVAGFVLRSPRVCIKAIREPLG